MRNAIRGFYAGALLSLSMAALGCSKSVPPLSNKVAWELISSSEDFNRTRELVTIDASSAGPSSMKEFGLASFTFRTTTPQGLRTPRKGTAQFWYSEGRWRVLDFTYSDSPG